MVLKDAAHSADVTGTRRVVQQPLVARQRPCHAAPRAIASVLKISRVRHALLNRVVPVGARLQQCPVGLPRTGQNGSLGQRVESAKEGEVASRTNASFCANGDLAGVGG